FLSTALAPTNISSLSLHDALPILGYFNDAGLLFYRGRKDFQIKFNGYRIELEELNFFLKQQELVDQGAIVPRYNAGHKVTQLIRSEEHTSELQSRFDLVCRLLLEK